MVMQELLGIWVETPIGMTGTKINKQMGKTKAMQKWEKTFKDELVSSERQDKMKANFLK